MYMYRGLCVSWVKVTLGLNTCTNSKEKLQSCPHAAICGGWRRSHSSACQPLRGQATLIGPWVLALAKQSLVSSRRFLSMLFYLHILVVCTRKWGLLLTEQPELHWHDAVYSLSRSDIRGISNLQPHRLRAVRSKWLQELLSAWSGFTSSSDIFKLRLTPAHDTWLDC